MYKRPHPNLTKLVEWEIVVTLKKKNTHSLEKVNIRIKKRKRKKTLPYTGLK